MSRFSSRTMKAADWKAIRHFEPKEFRTPTRMGYEFMRWIDQVRIEAGVPMYPSSSYRSPAHNKSVGGAKDSSHTDDICNAIDIRKSPTVADPNWNNARFKIVTAAMKLGCRRIGIYKDGSLHFDRTEDERPTDRLWVAVDNPA